MENVVKTTLKAIIRKCKDIYADEDESSEIRAEVLTLIKACHTFRSKKTADNLMNIARVRIKIECMRMTELTTTRFDVIIENVDVLFMTALSLGCEELSLCSDGVYMNSLRNTVDEQIETITDEMQELDETGDLFTAAHDLIDDLTNLSRLVDNKHGFVTDANVKKFEKTIASGWELLENIMT